MSIVWIDSGGGPLICASAEAAAIWLGTEGSSSGEKRSDYDRACAEIGYLSKLNSPLGDMLVLGDEPLRSAFVPGATGFAVARWVSCISQEIARDVLREVPEGLPVLQEPVQYRLDDEDLVLFDAAMPHAEGETLHAKVAPGLFDVTTERFEDRRRFDFILHRFRVRT